MNNITDKELDWKLRSKDPPVPKFYRIPKIYKINICIIPIVSYAGTTLLKLSIYIASILTIYTKLGNGNSSYNFT